MEKGKVSDDIKLNIEEQRRTNDADGHLRSTKFFQFGLSIALVVSLLALYGNLQLRGQIHLLKNDIASLQKDNIYLLSETQSIWNVERLLTDIVKSIQNEIRLVHSEIEKLNLLDVKDSGNVQTTDEEEQEDAGSGGDSTKSINDNDGDDIDDVTSGSGDFYLNDIDDMQEHDYKLKENSRPSLDSKPSASSLDSKSSASSLDSKSSDPRPLYMLTRSHRGEIKQDTVLGVRVLQDSGSKVSAVEPGAGGSLLSDKGKKLGSNLKEISSEMKARERRRFENKSKNRPRWPSSYLSAVHFEAIGSLVQYDISPDFAPVILPIWQDSNISTSSAIHGLQLNSSSGIVTVKNAGIYFVYAQVVFRDYNTHRAFDVYVNDKVQIKCVIAQQSLPRTPQKDSSPSLDDLDPSSPPSLDDLDPSSLSPDQQCYTARILKLTSNDKISIRFLHGHEIIVLQPQLTFWGLVRLN